MGRYPRLDALGVGGDGIAILLEQLKPQPVARRRRAKYAAGGGLAAFLAAAGAAAREDLALVSPADDQSPNGGYRIADSAADLFAVANLCVARDESVEAHLAHFGHALASWIDGGDFASRLESRLGAPFEGLHAHAHGGGETYAATSDDHAAHDVHGGSDFSVAASAHGEHSSGAASAVSALSHAHAETAGLEGSSTASVLHAAHEAMAAEIHETSAAAFGPSNDHQISGSSTISRVHAPHAAGPGASATPYIDFDDTITALIGEAEAAPASTPEPRADSPVHFLHFDAPPVEPLLTPPADL